VTDQKKPAEEYIVIRHRPGYRVRRTLILLTFSVVAAVVGYAAGMAQGGFRFSSAEDSRERLSEQVEQLRSANREMSQQLVNLERGRAVDEQALNQARRTIVELETRVATMQSELVFYKNIMAPSESTRGLQIDRVRVRAAGASAGDVFEFMVVLVQRGDNKSYLSGSVEVSLVGRRNEQSETIALKDLSGDIENTDIKLRFKYFQEVEGTLTLPEDFEPLELRVMARRDGSDSAQVERTFDWDELTEN
jgi:cell division protein FtsB